MVWVFPTAYKRVPVWIIRFILQTLNNEHHPCKCIIVDEDGDLENSTDYTNLLVDELKTSMETTSADASWINCENERHSIIIYNMVIADLIEINQYANKWCCASDTSAEFHRWKLHI